MGGGGGGSPTAALLILVKRYAASGAFVSKWRPLTLFVVNKNVEDLRSVSARKKHSSESGFGLGLSLKTRVRGEKCESNILYFSLGILEDTAFNLFALYISYSAVSNTMKLFGDIFIDKNTF